ncbi:MAG TPA: hypothetical protein VGB75_10315 [Jatrophihabitans sp.]|jgi:hypothetical protein|uniref:hypothetical protein n=1 Tax=Jatrophihabitans sp. TaxID=1932789 RepID=UPI002F0231E8
MSEHDQNGDDHNLEEAASEGRLPGLEEAELAEREGRDVSETPDTEVDGTADDDAPAGGVVMGAINQH